MGGCGICGQGVFFLRTIEKNKQIHSTVFSRSLAIKPRLARLWEKSVQTVTVPGSRHSKFGCPLAARLMPRTADRGVVGSTPAGGTFISKILNIREMLQNGWGWVNRGPGRCLRVFSGALCVQTIFFLKNVCFLKDCFKKMFFVKIFLLRVFC